jgi:spore germination protein KC
MGTGQQVSENTSKLDLNSPSDRSYLNELLAADIKGRIEHLCKKVQKELQSDIFGFGLNIYKQDTQAWNSMYTNEWRALFPNVKVLISVNAHVAQTGLMGKGAIREDIK